jgi:hypothetical protein
LKSLEVLYEQFGYSFKNKPEDIAFYGYFFELLTHMFKNHTDKGYKQKSSVKDTLNIIYRYEIDQHESLESEHSNSSKTNEVLMNRSKIYTLDSISGLKHRGHFVRKDERSIYTFELHSNYRNEDKDLTVLAKLFAAHKEDNIGLMIKQLTDHEKGELTTYFNELGQKIYVKDIILKTQNNPIGNVVKFGDAVTSILYENNMIGKRPPNGTLSKAKLLSTFKFLEYFFDSKHHYTSANKELHQSSMEQISHIITNRPKGKQQTLELQFSEDEEITYTMIDKTGKPIDSGEVTRVPDKHYYEQFSPNHIHTRFTDETVLQYDRTVLITNEVLDAYKKSVQETEKGNSRLLLDILASKDSSVYIDFMNFLTSDPTRKSKHIMSYTMTDAKKAEFEKRVRDTIVDILFQEGTPFYITSRKQSNTNKDPRNINTILSHKVLADFTPRIDDDKTIKDQMLQVLKSEHFHPKVSDNKKKFTLQDFVSMKKTVDKMKTTNTRAIYVVNLTISKNFKSIKDKNKKRMKCDSIRGRMKMRVKNLRKSYKKHMKKMYNNLKARFNKTRKQVK